ncbi:MAG: BNR/Asp-box repeat protein [Acidobacteriales bacterium]|nr:BNR/Asp-box repeat protein [Terriglobales bacterium]
MKILSKFSLVLCLLALSLSTFAQSKDPKPKRDAKKDAAPASAPASAMPAEKNDAAAPDAKPKDPMENLTFRNLGPAAGGGRVSAVVGIPNQPMVYYVGAAAGGVFKTTDAGMSWKAIFDKEAVASIGAIALAPSNPNIVWVGTGESNIRNDVSTGKGVYMSTDAGNTWRFMGLKNVGQISNILIDPNNSNTVFVGAIGHAWGPNADRGVFRTTDGGKNWEKVLYINDKTGVSSLVMDPANPMVLFAGMWQMQRSPWMMVSGGPSSGIYRSTDGGSTWKKLSEGLPEGPLGNIGLAVAPSNPRHIYALVEAKKGILWDSLDFGDHWKEVSNNHALNARPFYFSEMMVSPNDEQRVYFLSFDVLASNDGGKTAQVIARGVHPDNHSIWIDPQHPERIILGNDGGVYTSADTGKNWRFLNNLPIEQFYQVAHDDETPYNLCGGLQDNNGWCGPSNSLSRGGIGDADWFTVVGGDGEYIVPAMGGSKTVYADSQNGSIQKVNISNGLSKSLRPYFFGVGNMKPADLKYRFNWTSPIAVSPKTPDEVYIGGNVVFKSTDGGLHWKPISPDLTRNDRSKQESSGGPVEFDLSGAETYDTILSLSVSQVDPKIIWVGTDDGMVQVTKDGGEHWTDVTPNIPNLPQWGRVQQIEPSSNDPASGYVAVDFHEVDNDRAYVYKTHDFGKTWTSIAAGIPEDQPARVIRENPNQKGFLVVGTETGLFYSLDDGAKWIPIKSNFPTVPIYDIKFVKKSHDLVVATHGRGLFVLDNITPLEESASIGSKPFHLFTARGANNWRFWNKRASTAGGFVAPNPPTGAVIDYYLANEIKPQTPGAGASGTAATETASAAASEPPAGGGRRGGAGGPGAGGRGGVRIVITDMDGKIVRTLTNSPSKMGYNRTEWDMRYQGPTRLSFLPTPGGEEGGGGGGRFGGGGGPPVMPGTYKVSVTVAGKTETQTIEVGPDPRFPVDLAALKTQIQTGLQLRDQVSAFNEALNRIASLKKQISSIEELLNSTGGDDAAAQGGPGGGPRANAAYRPVVEQARALRKKLDALELPLYNHDIQPGASDDIHYLSRFSDRLNGIFRSVVSDYGAAPNEMQLEEMAEVRKALDGHLKDLNALLTTDVVAFNKMALDAGSSTLFAGIPIEIKSAGAQSGASN